MNTDLLCEWLSLPVGNWPPDDRVLLGLPPGPLTALDVETRALAQMERLRPHQLVHADLVTEGMNRLAQALISLTDEAKRQNQPPAAKSSLKNELELDDLQLDASEISGPPKPPMILEAEVISTKVPKMSDRLATRQSKKAKARTQKTRRKRKEKLEAPIDVPELEPIPPGSVSVPGERRQGYAKLVALRRLLKCWEELQPYLAAPSESLETPATVFGFVDAMRSCRRCVAVDGDRAWFEEHGQIVLALVKNPLALSIFRSLLLGQRQALATDWARSTAHLRAYYKGLRREMNSTKPRRKWGATLRGLGSAIRSNPEWIMATLLVVAIVTAFVRNVSRTSSGP